jgi:hypothetical protein
MKSNKLQFLSLALFLCIISSLVSCEDDDYKGPIEDNNSGQTIRYLTMDEIPAQSKFHEAYAEMISTQRSRFKSGDSIPSSLVDASNGAHITSGEYESYTFPVFRSHRSDPIQNILFTKVYSGEFIPILVSYSLTDGDLENIDAGTFVDSGATIVSMEPLNTDFQFAKVCGGLECVTLI